VLEQKPPTIQDLKPEPQVSTDPEMDDIMAKIAAELSGTTKPA
jgi:hypothetical protein